MHLSSIHLSSLEKINAKTSHWRWRVKSFSCENFFNLFLSAWGIFCNNSFLDVEVHYKNFYSSFPFHVWSIKYVGEDEPTLTRCDMKHILRCRHSAGDNEDRQGSCVIKYYGRGSRKCLWIFCMWLRCKRFINNSLRGIFILWAFKGQFFTLSIIRNYLIEICGLSSLKRSQKCNILWSFFTLNNRTFSLKIKIKNKNFN